MTDFDPMRIRGQRLPNFLLVGAAKAGTTSLYHYLDAHPQVFMSPIKEPCHFARDVIEVLPPGSRHVLALNYRAYLRSGGEAKFRDAFVPTWDAYCRLYDRAAGQTAIGEASTFYLLSSRAAKDIKDAIPDAKILIILRNPVDRAYSHHLMNVRAGSATKPFVEEFRKGMCPGQVGSASYFYSSMGQYSCQVERYLHYFDDSHVRILLYDDMKANPAGVVEDVFRFLQINCDFRPELEDTFNRARLPRFPRLNTLLLESGLKKWFGRNASKSIAKMVWKIFFSERDLPRLRVEERLEVLTYFRSDIERLQSVIGRDLNDWLH